MLKLKKNEYRKKEQRVQDMELFKKKIIKPDGGANARLWMSAPTEPHRRRNV